MNASEFDAMTERADVVVDVTLRIPTFDEYARALAIIRAQEHNASFVEAPKLGQATIKIPDGQRIAFKGRDVYVNGILIGTRVD